MKCALIILNYNDSHRAFELAQKSIEYDNVDRVIIVDNKSTDNSLKYLQNKIDGIVKIDLLKARENRGFASGNNIGAKYAIEKYKPQYVLFANTDTIFEEKDIDECIRYMRDVENLGLVSMRIKDIKGREEKSAWKFKSFYEYAMFNTWLYRRLNYKKNTYTNYAEKFQLVQIVRGSFMFFNAKVLKNIGYFDEETFLYYEEEIISKKLQMNGYKVGLITDHFYIHNHIAGGSSNVWFIKKYMVKSLYYFLDKYYKIGKIKKTFFLLTIGISYVEELGINTIKRIMKK